MPMDRRLYPSNWNEIALSIKNEVNWVCEECGRACRRSDESALNFIARISTSPHPSECPVVYEFLTYPKRFMLTVAHLDHVPQNVDRKNLKAWCTGCHCRHDLKAMTRKVYLKRERLGQMNLFGEDLLKVG